MDSAPGREHIIDGNSNESKLGEVKSSPTTSLRTEKSRDFFKGAPPVKAGGLHYCGDIRFITNSAGENKTCLNFFYKILRANFLFGILSEMRSFNHGFASG